MNADTFNSRYPVGQPVVVYPGSRPSDPRGASTCERVITRTRTTAGTTNFGMDVVMVEGWAAHVALTHVDPICGSQCPNHGHVCLRSPYHQAGICRDEKQKGTESCSWDPSRKAAFPQRGQLHAVLVAAVERSDDEWTVGRVKRLFHRDCGFTHILRVTIRRLLERLVSEGVLVRHETPGRRYYTRAGGSL